MSSLTLLLPLLRVNGDLVALKEISRLLVGLVDVSLDLVLLKLGDVFGNYPCAIKKDTMLENSAEAITSICSLVADGEEAYAIPVALLAFTIGAFFGDVLRHAVRINDLTETKCISIGSP